jgi:hypothetical protein
MGLRGKQFIEASGRERLMAVLIVFWLICGGIAAMIASSKGGSGGLGFVAGALLGPLGIVVALFMGGDNALADKQVAAGERKKCPRCAELVQPDAAVCKHCGHEFGAATAAASGGG